MCTWLQLISVFPNIQMYGNLNNVQKIYNSQSAYVDFNDIFTYMGKMFSLHKKVFGAGSFYGIAKTEFGMNK